MKKIGNSLKIALAMYSKIPVGKQDWTGESMPFVLCFFPLVGVVIGACMIGWVFLYTWLIDRGIVLSHALYTAVLVVIPVGITGGIHLDGLLDTADALGSWQDKEKRLEILKDVHTGAFAVITGCVYFIACYGIYSNITTENVVPVALGFVLSRILSGLSVLFFPTANGTGLAALFSNQADKRMNGIVLGVCLVICMGLLVWVNPVCGGACIVSAGMVYWWYHHMAVTRFGGITGDLAGWFLQICELFLALWVVVASAIL